MEEKRKWVYSDIKMVDRRSYIYKIIRKIYFIVRIQVTGQLLDKYWRSTIKATEQATDQVTDQVTDHVTDYVNDDVTVKDDDVILILWLHIIQLLFASIYGVIITPYP
jgi:hypothetical protein